MSLVDVFVLTVGIAVGFVVAGIVDARRGINKSKDKHEK